MRREKRPPPNTLTELERSAGFAALSPSQQDMLRASLAKKKGTANAAGTLADSDTNCHLAAFYLEKGAKTHGGPDRETELYAFQEAGYERDMNLSLPALRAQIEKAGFPCIVTMRKVDVGGRVSHPTHTFVALDNEQGEIRVWAKAGFSSAPYLAWLPDEYASRAPHDGVMWCTRRMATPE